MFTGDIPRYLPVFEWAPEFDGSCQEEEASEPEHHIFIGYVAAAETAARQEDRSKAEEFLSKAGAWVLDIASRIGVEIAVAAIKASQNLP